MSEAIRSFRDLTVWKKAIHLVKLIYPLARALPKEEVYGLSSQMRRAVVSIPSNIAEGFGRYNTKDYIHFLRIARGSNNEVETQLRICIEVGYLTEDVCAASLQLCDELNRMLNALLLKLSSKTP